MNNLVFPEKLLNKVLVVYYLPTEAKFFPTENQYLVSRPPLVTALVMFDRAVSVAPEVYYLHEVCHSCTNLVHGIVPEVYYLHEVCHSCTNLVHDIVPEVYYLHEVCHSCTNLVHGIVPEVYYLHEVCHSCTNLVHGTVLQEQWIWAIHDGLFFHRMRCKVTQRAVHPG